MSKNDFLEILRDYLKGSFSDLEINDILRDYEEFFLNGELQGKSDEEIITNLGSPKNIAKELILEIKGEGKAKAVDEDFKSKISRSTNDLWKSAKRQGKKAGDKTKKFLDSNSVLNGNISGVGVKLIMIIISLLLFFPSLFILFSMITSGLGLITMTIGNFVGYLGSAFLFGIDGLMGIFGLFLCIAWTGFTILVWTLYVLVCKLLKYLIVKYISWIKTRNMYVRVKKEQENNKETKEETAYENKENNDADIIMVAEEKDDNDVDIDLVKEDISGAIDVDCERKEEEKEGEIHE